MTLQDLPPKRTGSDVADSATASRRTPGMILERRATPSVSRVSVTFIILMLGLIVIGAFTSFQLRSLQNTIEQLDDSQGKIEKRLNVLEDLIYSALEAEEQGPVAAPATPAAARTPGKGTRQPARVAAASPTPAPVAASAQSTPPPSDHRANIPVLQTPAPEPGSRPEERFRDPSRALMAAAGFVPLAEAAVSGQAESASLPGLLTEYVIKESDDEGIWGIARNHLKYHYHINRPTGSEIQFYADAIVYYNVQRSGSKPSDMESLMPGDKILIPEYTP